MATNNAVRTILEGAKKCHSDSLDASLECTSPVTVHEPRVDADDLARYSFSLMTDVSLFHVDLDSPPTPTDELISLLESASVRPAL